MPHTSTLDRFEVAFFFWSAATCRRFPLVVKLQATSFPTICGWIVKRVQIWIEKDSSDESEHSKVRNFETCASGFIGAD